MGSFVEAMRQSPTVLLEQLLRHAGQQPGRSITAPCEACAESTSVVLHAQTVLLCLCLHCRINYATGVYPDGLRVKRADIATADLTMPVVSGNTAFKNQIDNN
jgi:hypothetical protein